MNYSGKVHEILFFINNELLIILYFSLVLVYLVAIIDLYSRYVVAWDVFDILDADNSLGLLERAISKHGKPEIINSDRGSQFTCPG